MSQDKTTSDLHVSDSAKKEWYKNNAQAAGAIPTQEDWGVSNGNLTITGKLTHTITKADVANYLFEEAKRQGITIEELVSQIGKNE